MLSGAAGLPSQSFFHGRDDQHPENLDEYRDRNLQQKAQVMIAPTGDNGTYMNLSHFYSVGPRR